MSLLCGLFSGASDIPPSKIFGLFASGHMDMDMDHRILQMIRLPRVLLAALAGACLASCGAVMQGLFRNPLADPSLIGVSSGASVGASCVIFFGGVSLIGGGLGLPAIAIGAFVGGLLAT
ncbi:MAG: iron chelate uptake ABC transporter family permease subunit, partial [Porticoccus sp.]